MIHPSLLVQVRLLINLDGRVDLADEPPTGKVADGACKG